MINHNIFDILSKMSESELRDLVLRYSNEMDAMSGLIRAQGNRISALVRINDSLNDLFSCMTRRVNCRRETVDFTHELLAKYAQSINTCENTTEDKEAKDDRI